MAQRPMVVAFDVIETLFSLAPVGEALERAGCGPRGLDLFFARMLRDGFALSAAGDYRRFPELAAQATTFVLPEASPEQRQAVLDAFDRLEPHPDAEPAMAALAGAGVRIVTLTNGGAETTSKLLQKAGLDRYVEATLSVEQPRRWKPAPEPYRFAADTLGLPPERLALVAVHSWDVHGAARVGLVTGWASRLEGDFPAVFEPPDVSGPDLVTVAGGLLELPRGPTA